MFHTVEIVNIWIVFLAISSYQLYLQFRSENRRPYSEGFPKTLQMLTGIPALAALGAFLLDPDLPSPIPFSLMGDIDFAGLVLFNIAAMFILWAHLTLGDCWSGDLETKSDHQLIDRGLYRFVRHPLYSSYLVLALGLYLLSDNVWVGATMLIYFLSVASRTWKEEAMMVERLGADYVAYRNSTGRFIPKLSSFRARSVAADASAERGAVA